MTDSRTTISAELRRRVFVEAGHRCAIPTCRFIEIEVHHIVPWEQCKNHEYENLIALCPNCHTMVHNEKIDRKSLKIYKSNLRYTHDRFSQFEVDVLFELFKLKSDETSPFPAFSRLLVKRLQDAEFIEFCEISKEGFFVGDLNINPEKVSITEKGRNFINSLGLEHEW